MRVLRISYLLLLFIPFLSCDTKGDFEEESRNYFLKYYGEDGNQKAVDMVVNADGTILLLGNTAIPGKPGRITLIKVDANGHVLWERKFGSGKDTQERTIDDYAQDLEPLADGNFLILSNMRRVQNNEELFDFKIIKIEPDGSTLDSMEFGNNNGVWETQFAKSITALSNNGFAVTGNSTNEDLYLDGTPNPSNPDLEDIFAIGFNSAYAVVWNTVEFDSPNGSSGGEHFGSGVKVFEKSNNENAFYYFTSSDALTGALDGTYESNFGVFTFSANGIPLEDNRIAGESGRQEFLAAVCNAPSQLGGGYYEFGTSSTNLTAQGSLYFSRRTNALEPAPSGWGFITDINGTFTAVNVAPAGVVEGFLLVANEKTTAGSTIRLIKVDVDSKVIWSANFGAFEKNNTGAAVAELPDGRILLLGTIELETQTKIALIKLNRNGELLN